MQKSPASPVPTAPRSPLRSGETAPVKVSLPVPANAGLGRRLAVYPGQPLGWGDLLFIFLPASLLVLAPLAWGFWRAWYAYTHFGPVAVNTWARPWYLLASLALIPVTAIALYRLYLAACFAAVHENGLRLRLSPFGRRELSWDQIDGIAAAAYQERLFGRPLLTWATGSLYLASGRPIRLDGKLQNLPRFSGHVKSILYPRLLPRLRARLEAGQWLRFGRLSIHLEALFIAGRQIPWSQVSRLGVQAGYLVVELGPGERLRRPVAQIPNLELLLLLVEQSINR